jgi:site-specific recombinase XerD
MRRVANPQLSPSGEEAVAQYRQVLWEHEDLTSASRRNYVSDLRHFAAWYEANCIRSTDGMVLSPTEFDPRAITTPALTRYRAYLQKDLCQKPNSVNRALISLKRYFSWTMQKQLISYGPSIPVKLVGAEAHAPRHLEDEEEQALVAAVTNEGTLRDRVLIVLLLHTGLRAREICQLRRDQVKLGKRSGTLEVIGKRNKYREVPLNATARKCWRNIFQLSLLPRPISSHQPKRSRPCQNARWATSSKNMRRRQNFLMSAPMICGTALATGWRSLFRCIVWHRSWDMIPWIQPGCTSRERNTICNRPSRPSPGHEGGTGYAGEHHRLSGATAR